MVSVDVEDPPLTIAVSRFPFESYAFRPIRAEARRRSAVVAPGMLEWRRGLIKVR
jgi:hypothetical protein